MIAKLIYRYKSPTLLELLKHTNPEQWEAVAKVWVDSIRYRNAEYQAMKLSPILFIKEREEK